MLSSTAARSSLWDRESNRDEHPPDRRLRPAVGLPFGRPGQPGRLGGLAVLPAVRRAGSWVALDRAIALAEQLDAGDRVDAWRTAREEIRAAILEHGWSEKAGAFTQAFGTDELDASNLMLAVTGFLPGDDPRMKATVDAIAERLTDERGLVYRYRAHDGLEGEEGTFLLCTFWLAQALAGEVDKARATFEQAVGYTSDVGLLAEEVDVLGNFPQAFSHIGLVNAAWAIAQAEDGAHRREPVTAGPGGGEPPAGGR
jgi:GH15 family glucan-1,4-alpha-glucosidase